MADYQQHISQLLELCQEEWVNLENMIKENKATPSIQHATRDLRDGIKQLVQLQDNLDEIGNIVENNTEWNKKADVLMEDVRNRLQFASSLTSKIQQQMLIIKPVTSQSSPLRFSQQKISSPPLNTTKEQEEEEDEDEEEEQFLDASDELPIQVPVLDLTIEPTSSSDILSRSSSLSSNASFQDKPFGRRSIIADDSFLQPSTEPLKKKTNLFPLFKGLHTSQSTPVKNNSKLAQINFFKENNEVDSKHYIFATDAMVDHPLRIGVGYGSYICYSCTITSDKGAPITVRKRYSDFVDLREELIKQYPNLKKSLPKLPPKKVVGKFTPTFVEQRRRELEYFFKYVVLHPVVGASPIIRHWIAP